MTCYVVVTRSKPQLPVKRFVTVEAAANYIVHARSYGKWTVLAQDANKITASTPYRELTTRERETFERALYPSLFD